jgi:hypothetical protein
MKKKKNTHIYEKYIYIYTIKISKIKKYKKTQYFLKKSYGNIYLLQLF